MVLQGANPAHGCSCFLAPKNVRKVFSGAGIAQPYCYVTVVSTGSQPLAFLAVATPESHARPTKVDLHQIGEVAQRVGLSLRTVRYYEEVGLIAPERRTDGGFRLYTEENIDRLRLIMQMKPLGFSVEEMRAVLEALDMLGSPDSDASARQAADQLREFAEFAERRCAKMRGHLAAGEKLVEQLAHSARRY
jgi:DNA-binding transcriptional MerR regulator